MRNNNFRLEHTRMKAEVYKSHRQLNNSEVFMQQSIYTLSIHFQKKQW